MPFGQVPTARDEDKPLRKTWDGTEKAAHEIEEWARDEALLRYAAVTPPSRDAADGTPEATWRLKVRVAVPEKMGGGEQWADVPKGAVVRNTNRGPSAWTDPLFEIITPSELSKSFS
jgi:hypothetical protein